jgi:hypothetical protein
MQALESPTLIRNGSYGLIELMPVLTTALLKEARAILDAWSNEHDPCAKAKENFKKIIRQMDADREWDIAGPGSKRWATIQKRAQEMEKSYRSNSTRSLDDARRQDENRRHMIIAARQAIDKALNTNFSEKDRAWLKQALKTLSGLPTGYGYIRTSTLDKHDGETLLLPKVNSWTPEPPVQLSKTLTENAWRWPLNRPIWEEVWAPARDVIAGVRANKINSFLELAAFVHALEGETTQAIVKRAVSLRAVRQKANSAGQPGELSDNAETLETINQMGQQHGPAWNADELVAGSRFLNRLNKGDYTQHDDPDEDLPDPMRETLSFALFFSTGYLTAKNKITPTLAAARLFASPQAANRAKPGMYNLPEGPDREVTPVVVEVLTKVVALAPSSPAPGSGQERISQVVSAIERDILRAVVAEPGDENGDSTENNEQPDVIAAPKRRRTM